MHTGHVSITRCIEQTTKPLQTTKSLGKRSLHSTPVIPRRIISGAQADSRQPLSRTQATDIILAALKGHAARMHLRVKTLAQGLMHIRIGKPDSPLGRSVTIDPQTPLRKIQEHMHPGTYYDQLRITRGANNAGVAGPAANSPPLTAPDIAQQQNLPPGTAFSNGGFFVHKNGMLNDQDTDCIEGDRQSSGKNLSAQRSYRHSSALAARLWSV